MRMARWNLPLLLTCWGTALAQDAVELTAPPATSAFDEALQVASNRPEPGYTPPFFGDLQGANGTKLVQTPGGPAFAFATINRHAGATKIADGESPRPVNRFYYGFSDFTRVNQDINPGLPPVNLQRHVLGFEKTLLGGWASVGLRVPLVAADGVPELSTRQVADMTIVTKVSLWDDRRRGRVLSSGLAITVPTGHTEIFTTPGSGNRYQLRDAILQPYVGWAWDVGERFFAHGFSSWALPTDSRDASTIFNDIAVGAWLLRDRGGWVRGLAPVVELHVNTPINRRGTASIPIGYLDSVNVTCGAHLLLGRAVLGGAVGVPISSPRPFALQAAARCELHY